MSYLQSDILESTVDMINQMSESEIKTTIAESDASDGKQFYLEISQGPDLTPTKDPKLKEKIAEMQK